LDGDNSLDILKQNKMDKENLSDLLDNPEKYLFGYEDMSDEKKKSYEEEFYSQQPKPNEEYDELGLRYDIDYLNNLGNNIVLCPVEFIANYVDVITKSLVDNNDSNFMENIVLDGVFEEADYPNLNATALGNMAYAYLHIQSEKVRQIIKETLIKVFVWKASQYKSLIDGLSTIN
jgi:hypothetical protein